MTVTSSGDHVFGRVRPSHDGDFQLNGKTVRVTTFRDLPAPTGRAPYHLDLRNIIPAGAYEEIVTTRKLVLHFNGDIGGIDFATPQQLVAAGMEADCDVPGQAAPRFLYLVGDCVYFNGEVSRYQIQRAVWQRYASTNADWTKPEDALVVAKAIMKERCDAFEKSHGRPPTDFEFYVLWNAPKQVEAPSQAVTRRAKRFCNLLEVK